MDNFGWDNNNIRRLDISDLERIARFRRAGYGGSVSDCMNSLGVRGTVLSDRFRPLRQGMQLVGRALPIKLHSLVGAGAERGGEASPGSKVGGGGGAPPEAHDARDCRPRGRHGALL